MWARQTHFTDLLIWHKCYCCFEHECKLFSAVVSAVFTARTRRLWEGNLLQLSVCQQGGTPCPGSVRWGVGSFLLPTLRQDQVVPSTPITCAARAVCQGGLSSCFSFCCFYFLYLSVHGSVPAPPPPPAALPYLSRTTFLRIHVTLRYYVSWNHDLQIPLLGVHRNRTL